MSGFACSELTRERRTAKTSIYDMNANTVSSLVWGSETVIPGILADSTSGVTVVLCWQDSKATLQSAWIHCNCVKSAHECSEHIKHYRQQRRICCCRSGEFSVEATNTFLFLPSTWVVFAIHFDHHESDKIDFIYPTSGRFTCYNISQDTRWISKKSSLLFKYLYALIISIQSLAVH